MSDLINNSDNTNDVMAFLNSIKNEKRKTDAIGLLELMEKATEKEAKMWGNNIVGFGKYEYKYESGREGTWFIAGFSPSTKKITLYIMRGFGEYQSYFDQLGKYSLGKSCFYISQLEDIDLEVLKALIEKTVSDIKKGAVVIEE